MIFAAIIKLLDSLLIGKKNIGNIKTDAKVNIANGSIDFSANNLDTTNIFSLIGTYNFKDSSNNPLDVNLEGEKINLSILVYKIYNIE